MKIFLDDKQLELKTFTELHDFLEKNEKNLENSEQLKTLRLIDSARNLDINLKTKPKRTFTDFDKNIMKVLLPRYKYIARDPDNTLWVFHFKPTKNLSGWCQNAQDWDYTDLPFDECFKTILWTDNEPVEIEKCL